MAPRKAAPKAAEPERVESKESTADVRPHEDKLTQFDQEAINAERLGNDEAKRAAAKRKDALERSSVPPQRRSTREGRTEA